MWTISKLCKSGSQLYIFILLCAAIRIIHTVDIVCPGDIQAYADVGEISTSVTWRSPFTSADTVNVVSSHDPGQIFFIGSSNIVYIAIDGGGNSQSCSFIVTVLRDDIPIIINCPPNRVYPADSGSDSAVAFWTPPSFSDESGPLTTVESHPSGSRFSIGITKVTYVVTDVTNNTVTCAFTITVEDRQNPTFTDCPTSASGKALAGTTSSVIWTPPTANDNSGLYVTMTSTHDPGDSFGIGNTAVSYTAIDVGGNTGVCTFTVTIKETSGPSLNNCPQSQSVINDAGEDFAIISWTEPTASDDDDVPSLTSSHNPGDSFDIGVTLVTYMAVDGDGFTAKCAFALTVTDAENPIITNCPSDITTNVLPTNNPVSLSWRQPSASDNADQSVSMASSHNSGDPFPSGQTQVIYTAKDDAGNQATCTFTITVIVVEPVDTTSYNGTLGLDRIASVNGPFTTRNGLLSDSLIQQIDAVLRTSSISTNYVGIDSITTSLNNNGIAVLEYTLHVIPDSGYSAQGIEQSFEDNLTGMDNNEFLDSNRVVNASFVVGICPIDYCMNDGQCYLDKDNFVSACQCPSDYVGVQCESDAPLSLTLIIIISVTSAVFGIVIILLIICCVLSLLSHDESVDKEKFTLSESEKAKGIRNPVPVVMVTGGKSGIQDGGKVVMRDDVFYPDSVGLQSFRGKSMPNGNVGAKPFSIGDLPNGTVYLPNGNVRLPIGVPIGSGSQSQSPALSVSTSVPTYPNGNIPNSTEYLLNGSIHLPNGAIGVPNGNAPQYQNPNPITTSTNALPKYPNGNIRNGTVYLPNGSISQPRNHIPVSRTAAIPSNPNPNLHPTPVPVKSNSTTSDPYNPTPRSIDQRYLPDDGYLLDDRPRVLVPVRKTKLYGDHNRMAYDYDDDRRRRRRHRKSQRTRRLGHDRLVYMAPSLDLPRQGRRRKRSRPKRTSSLILPCHPDRDYSLPRELRDEFYEAQQSRPVFDYRPSRLDHLDLETSSRTPQQPCHPDRDYSLPRELRDEFYEAQQSRPVFDSSDNSGYRPRRLDHLDLEKSSRTPQQPCHPDRDYSLPRELRDEFYEAQQSRPVFDFSDNAGYRLRRPDHLDLETSSRTPQQPGHPDRDYSLPRELRDEFYEAQQSRPVFDSSDNAGYRPSRLDHLDLETSSRTPQQDSYPPPPPPVSTAYQPVDQDVPPPPAFPPPPPPLPTIQLTRL